MVLGIAGWFPLHPTCPPRGGRNRGRRSSRPPQRSYGVYTTQPEANSHLRPRRDALRRDERMDALRRDGRMHVTSLSTPSHLNPGVNHELSTFIVIPAKAPQSRDLP